MTHSNILVVGGSGFIGSSVVARLASSGYRVRVPTRHRERARHLILLPGVDVVQADVHDPAALRRLMDGCDAVINLVGILHGRAGADGWGPDFQRAHVALPTLLARTCAELGIRRLIHMSALGVVDGGERTLPSRYLRSKAAGEAAVRAQSGLDVTVLRPSVVFGADDAFLNLFAQLQTVLPVVALAGSQARFQPIWVADVAQAIVNVLDDPRSVGKAFELAGPEVFTLRELVQLSGTWSGHRRPVIGLPQGLGRLVATMMELAPGEPLMSRDNVDSMSIDNVATRPMAPELGLQPASLRALGPELYGGGVEGRQSEWRTRAGR
jgi:NADH dehydrogenase